MCVSKRESVNQIKQLFATGLSLWFQASLEKLLGDGLAYCCCMRAPIDLEHHLPPEFAGI